MENEQKSIGLHQLKKRLNHVLWIGGATDAGKTTIATLLSDKYGFEVYNGDKHGQGNWDQITVEKQPAMTEWLQMNEDERWLHMTLQKLTDQTYQIMEERFPLIVDDLLDMPNKQIIVAEWYGFLPNKIVPLLSNMNQALWLFPSKAFKQYSVQRRGKMEFHLGTSDPKKAWEKHLKRDQKLAEIIKLQAQRIGGQIVINTGKHNANEMLAQIETYFATFLL